MDDEVAGPPAGVVVCACSAGLAATAARADRESSQRQQRPWAVVKRIMLGSFRGSG